MNPSSLHSDTLANKISYWHLVCFLMALPFDFFYSQLVLASFAIHTLIHLQKESIKNVFTKQVLMIVSIYLLGLLALLYSPDRKEGVNILTRQLAILIIPVVFALNKLDIEAYKISLLKVFAYTCTVAIVYLYTDAIYDILYLHRPLSSLLTLAFMNHNFSLPIGMHATYLSMYVAFSISIFLYMLLKDAWSGIKYLYLFCLLILSAGMLQLSSRAVFIALLVILNVALPFILFTSRKRVLLFIAMSFLSIATITIIYHIDSFKLRYVNDFKKDLTDKASAIENEEPRMERWLAILELVKKKPVIGYGTGAEKNLLQEKYFEKKLFNSYINEFNTHNEYLSFLVKTGIIGLLLYLFVLFSGVAAAWKRRDFIFMAFMALIVIVSVSENVLDLNKGIFFYSFFFSFFLIQQPAVQDEDYIVLPLETGNHD